MSSEKLNQEACVLRVLGEQDGPISFYKLFWELGDVSIEVFWRALESQLKAGKIVLSIPKKERKFGDGLYRAEADPQDCNTSTVCESPKKHWEEPALKTEVSGAAMIALAREKDFKQWEGGRRDRLSFESFYGESQLTRAAIAYAFSSMGDINADCHWPWHPNQFVAGTTVEDLVKSGTFIAAEIDRRLRLEKEETKRCADVAFSSGSDEAQEKAESSEPGFEEAVLRSLNELLDLAKTKAGQKTGPSVLMPSDH